MSIFIATPMYGGACTAHFHQSAMRLQEELQKASVHFDWLVTRNESLITRARNTSVSAFLKSDFDKLLFIDADIEFRPIDVAHLWNAQVPVIAGAYSNKDIDATVGVWRGGKLEPMPETGEPIESDYAGTGFMMIDRSVFQEMQKAHPEWAYEEGKVGQCWAFFQDPIEEHTDGTRFHLSEDYFFCKRYREMGGTILMHPEVKLIHWGQFGY